MPTLQDFKEEKPTFAVLALAEYGTGKTRLGCTFPKFGYIGFEPHGLDVLKNADGQKFIDNLVEYEYLIPENEQEAKQMFSYEFEKGEGRLFQIIDKYKKMHQEGLIDTLFIDNVSYLSFYIWSITPKVFSRAGELDERTMYGSLRDWFIKFLDRKVLTFKGNIYTTCHLKRETAEVLVKKVNQESDVKANILGSARDLIEGKFGAAIYLDRKKTPQGQTKFLAYCNKQKALGTIITAKNRYGLPDVVEDISYQTLMEYNQTK